MIYPASIWPIYFGAKGSVHDLCATSRMARRNCSRRARQGRFAVIDGARPPGSMFNERGGHGGSAGACLRRRLLSLLPPHNATRRRLQGQQRTHPTRASGLRASRPGRARSTRGDGKRAAARPPLQCAGSSGRPTAAPFPRPGSFSCLRQACPAPRAQELTMCRPECRPADCRARRLPRLVPSRRAGAAGAAGACPRALLWRIRRRRGASSACGSGEGARDPIRASQALRDRHVVRLALGKAGARHLYELGVGLHLQYGPSPAVAQARADAAGQLL